jgi:RNA polymerase subunit RPABC4/transcription elongation factor Spt4
LKACKVCHALTEEPTHCEQPTSKNWSGHLTILDAGSELAKSMNIEKPGQYALKVR